MGQLGNLLETSLPKFFDQPHLSKSKLALLSVGFTGYTRIISTRIDFLIRPPDTPAVLVLVLCTVYSGSQLVRSRHQLRFQLSVPTTNKQPTQPSSVGVKSSPCELSAPSSARTTHLLLLSESA